MTRILFIDEGLRGLFSKLYRVFIIFLSIVVFTEHENTFPLHIYWGASFVYFLLFLFLSKKPILRLILDYAYLFLIIWGKSYNTSSLIFLLIILPLVNFPNHSGKKSSPILVTLFSMGLYFYLIREDFSLSLWGIAKSIAPFFVIASITFFAFLRNKILSLNEYFNSAIERHFEDNVFKNGKPHHALRNITDVLNSSRLISFKTERLICFKLTEYGLFIIGSTKFVYKFNLSNEKKFFKALREQQIIKNWPIELNDESTRNNLLIQIKSRTDTFIFLFTIKGPYFDFIYNSILTPVLLRLVKVLVMETALQDQKRIYLNETKNKLGFLEEILMAMHFIKNKLGPVKNFIAMLDDHKSAPQDQIPGLKDLIEAEIQKAKRNLPLIIERAQKIQNPDNPFNFSKKTEHNIKKVVALVRSCWDHHFSQDRLVFNMDFKSVDQSTIELNEDGLELLLTNWISNMEKYNNGAKSVTFEDLDSHFRVVFRNNYLKENKADVLEFISNFNSEQRDEIINRTTKTRG